MSRHRSFVVSEPRLIHRGGDRPSFGPKGDAVVFHVQTKDGISLWIVDSDGYDPRLLYPPAGTQNPDASRPDWSWSETIAFSNHGEIWTVRPVGTEAQPYFRGTLPLTGATRVVLALSGLLGVTSAPPRSSGSADGARRGALSPGTTYVWS